MTSTHLQEKKFKVFRIFYDGECPFCTRYATYQKLAQISEEIHVLDMRADDNREAILQLIEEGLNPNNGVVVQTLSSPEEGFVTRQGAEAMKFLASLDNSGRFGARVLSVFRIRWAGRFLFPILRFGRLLLLKVMGVRLSAFDSGTSHRHR